MQKLIVSEETQVQNDALGAFLRQLEKTRVNMAELAKAYQACVDQGVDLGRYVSKGMAFRLSSLACGKLLPDASERLLGNDAMTSTMAQLAADTQKRLLAEGVEVWRDNKATIVPVDEVRPSEARRLLDVTAGRPRLLGADEQAARSVPPKPRHDKIVELRVAPEEMEALNIAAHKAGQSVAHYVKRQLYLAGIIGSKAMRKAG